MEIEVEPFNLPLVPLPSVLYIVVRPRLPTTKQVLESGAFQPFAEFGGTLGCYVYVKP